MKWYSVLKIRSKYWNNSIINPLVREAVVNWVNQAQPASYYFVNIRRAIEPMLREQLENYIKQNPEIPHHGIGSILRAASRLKDAERGKYDKTIQNALVEEERKGNLIIRRGASISGGGGKSWVFIIGEYK